MPRPLAIAVMFVGLSLSLGCGVAGEPEPDEVQPTVLTEERLAEALARFGWVDGRFDRATFHEVVSLREAAIAPLERHFLAGRDVWVRSQICLALAVIGSREAVPFLVERLEEEEGLQFTTKRFVVSALGELGDSRAVEPLLTQIRSPDDRFTSMVPRGHAAIEGQLLELSGQAEGLPFLNNDVVIRALGKIGDPRALEPLRGIVTSGSTESWSSDEIRRSIQLIETRD